MFFLSSLCIRCYLDCRLRLKQFRPVVSNTFALCSCCHETFSGPVTSLSSCVSDFHLSWRITCFSVYVWRESSYLLGLWKHYKLRKGQKCVTINSKNKRNPENRRQAFWLSKNKTHSSVSWAIFSQRAQHQTVKYQQFISSFVLLWIFDLTSSWAHTDYVSMNQWVICHLPHIIIHLFLLYDLYVFFIVDALMKRKTALNLHYSCS